MQLDMNIDTYAINKELIAAGFSVNEAESLIKQFKFFADKIHINEEDFISKTGANTYLATKEDLKITELALTKEIESIKLTIAQNYTSQIRYMVIMTGVIITVLGFLIKM